MSLFYDPESNNYIDNKKSPSSKFVDFRPFWNVWCHTLISSGTQMKEWTTDTNIKVIYVRMNGVITNKTWHFQAMSICSNVLWEESAMLIERITQCFQHKIYIQDTHTHIQTYVPSWTHIDKGDSHCTCNFLFQKCYHTIWTEINISKHMQYKLHKYCNCILYFKKLIMPQQKPRLLMVYNPKPNSLLAL